MPRRKPRSLPARIGSSSANEHGAVCLHRAIDCSYEQQHGAPVNDPEPGSKIVRLVCAGPPDSGELPTAEHHESKQQASMQQPGHSACRPSLPLLVRDKSKQLRGESG